MKAGTVALALVVTLTGAAIAVAGPGRHHHRRHIATGRAGTAAYAGVYCPAYQVGPYGRSYEYGAYGPTSAAPYPATAADDRYNPYAPPGAAIRALSRRNQYAPGVTNELAPDNIATATGGPSGGVPGFSGH